MRLLNTTALTLNEFFGVNIPPYAILSHRWEGCEVTFQDLQSEPQPASPSFLKITRCCAQAVSDGIEWVWIDTCCIDKTSSAELSEAINSMFRWYREADVCYAYLSDVPGRDLSGVDPEAPQQPNSAFRRSQWFTRGWTLQELLAPETVVFFNKDWEDIGTKNSMEDLLSSITGINSLANFESACVAQKFSWGSRRQTTREEDGAYCLMGLFGVHMPPLYGEGKNAFYRLQLEILRSTTDETIFAWANSAVPEDQEDGILAESPLAFIHSQFIERRTSLDISRPEMAMTNIGMRMELYLIPDNSSPTGVERFLAPLNCGDRRYSKDVYLAMTLVRVSGDLFSRVSPTVRNIQVPDDGINNDRRRTLVYLSRKSDKSLGSRSYTWLFLDHASLIEHGFDFLQIAEVAKVSSKLPTWESHSIGNTVSTSMQQVFSQEIATVYLRYMVNKTGEYFILAISISYGAPHLSIVIPDAFANFDSIKNIIQQRRNARLGRSSKLLPSGRSVSVALQIRPQYGTGRYYTVEIVIDLGGELRWPS